MAQTVILRGPDQRALACDLIRAAPDDASVHIIEKDKRRTDRQNRTIHMWFGEIAKHRGDMTALDVKGECHRMWGLAIRLRCPKFSWIWGQTGAKLEYEQQCNLLASGILSVSSAMNVSDLSEYMDGMMRHFRQQGVYLTDPELKGYDP